MTEQNHAPVRTGALTLLIVVVVIGLSLLAVLTFSTARADAAMANRYGQQVALQTSMENKGEIWLSEVDEAIAQSKQNGTLVWDDLQAHLPQGTVLDTRSGEVSVTLTSEEGNGSLYAAVAVLPDGTFTVTAWQLTTDWEEDTSLNVWQG